MAQHAQELAAALSDQGALLEEMLLVLDEERGCVLGRDLEGLEQRVLRKKELFLALEAEGTRCARVIQAMALEVELPEAQSLTPVLDRVDEPHRESLRGSQRRVLELGALLEKRLAANADLLQGALQTVTGTLDFFSRLFNNSNTYGYGGNLVGSGAAQPRIICREA